MHGDQQPHADGTPLHRLELRCPPLPQTLVEAMGLIDQPEKLEVGPVTDMVERDPIVIARLLHLVNSAYYGLRHAVTSAERAVVMLGPVAVAGIVVGMNMLKLRTTLHGPTADTFQRLIEHSVATAFITRHLIEGPPRDPTQHTGSSRLGTSFTAGMLHDFGKIILVYNYPEEASAFYDLRALQHEPDDEDPRELERMLFGCDHCEAGGFVARKLGFPATLAQLIEHHHGAIPEKVDAETARLHRTVALANLASKAMGYAFAEPARWDMCLASSVLRDACRLDMKGASPERIVLEIQRQKDHLDEYVRQMSTAPSAAPRAVETGPKRAAG